MQEPAIKIENLRIVYNESKKDEKVAVHGLNLEVQPGEFFGLLGPNGAGKTTVISAMTNLIDFNQGEISIFGHERSSIAAKRCIGVVPQELVHYGFFTVNEILNFFSGYFGIRNNQKRIDFLLDRLALKEQKGRLVSQLSGGMKRRLLIAKALVHSPQLLLLDEPSAGVDVELRSSLWKFMRELNAEGMTILLTTHYLEEAQRLCGRVAIMNHGRLISLDHTGELLEQMVDREIEIRLKTEMRLSPQIIESPPIGINRLRQTDRRIQVLVTGKTSLQEVIEKLGLSLEIVEDIQMREGALEDAFLRIVERDKMEACG